MYSYYIVYCVTSSFLPCIPPSLPPYIYPSLQPNSPTSTHQCTHVPINPSTHYPIPLIAAELDGRALHGAEILNQVSVLVRVAKWKFYQHSHNNKTTCLFMNNRIDACSGWYAHTN